MIDKDTAMITRMIQEKANKLSQIIDRYTVLTVEYNCPINRQSDTSLSMVKNKYLVKIIMKLSNQDSME